MQDDDREELEGSDDTATEGDLDTEALVHCPHCGEAVTIALDPGGGKTQEYVEDCEVCCRPWRVRVWYHAGGSAEVELQPVE